MADSILDRVRSASQSAAQKIVADMKAEGAFEPFRNPDGTYNGVKALSAVSGIPEAEVLRIWEDVKAKKAKR